MSDENLPVRKATPIPVTQWEKPIIPTVLVREANGSLVYWIWSDYRTNPPVGSYIINEGRNNEVS